MTSIRTILLFLLLVPAGLSAAVIRTGPGSLLQHALDRAQPGDTILVAPGLYKQHEIVVRTPVTIIGENYPVFDGENKYQILIVSADKVNIQGITVQNTGRSSMVDMAGIRLQNVSRVTVSNCRVLNTTYGVYLQGSRFCVIENNEIRSSATDELQAGNGVHAWKSDSLLIRNNKISGHRDGIYFEFVTGSAIIGNISTNNVRYGLHFMFSHNDGYSRNIFRHNGAGVAVMYSKKVVMTGNTFGEHWGDASYGILLKDISDSRIEHNNFAHNTIGIFMEGSNRIHVLRNTFNANGWAMRVQASCEGNTIETNNFTENSFDVATNGTLMLNTWRDNYWDKYEGYDLNRDGTGDVPYHPVSVYSILSERIPSTMILYRSFLTNIIDQAEKIMPSIIPDQLRDDSPKTKKWKL
ncbi:nitrous oxide reductase family maturation protein NosD [Chitinophaga sp.]|uniref:nitrous oxide reductase family maturation protein NosD n=1 Tax=Chitinophaga sp. TaxID=1869181 RepID=UPI002618DF73|nr:nitrous oxide reductase family maturation protein NosD [uncultured Chitinophaga sp.]